MTNDFKEKTERRDFKMNLSVKSNLNSFTFECIIENDDVLDRTALEMITNYEMKGFAKAEFVQFNSDKKLLFHLNNCITLKDYLVRGINASVTMSIIKKMIKTIDLAEDYLIDPSTILLNDESVFISLKSDDIYVICLPFDRTISLPSDLLNLISALTNNSLAPSDETEYNYYQDVSDAIKECKDESFEKIVREFNIVNAKYSSHERPVLRPKGRYGQASEPNKNVNVAKPAVTGVNTAGNSAYQQPNHISSKYAIPNSNIADKRPQHNEPNAVEDDGEDISLFYLLQHYNADNLKKYKSKKNRSKDSNKPVSSPHPSVNNRKGNFDIPNAQNKNQSVYDGSINTSTNNNLNSFNEKSGNDKLDIKRVRGNFGDTVHVMPNEIKKIENNKKNMPYLVCSRDGRKISINKNVFVLGRNNDEVDFTIEDPTVGRKHAKIVTENGVCKICDLGSVNKTFVNGFEVTEGMPVQLKSGDLVMLSSFTFEFYCE